MPVRGHDSSAVATPTPPPRLTGKAARRQPRARERAPVGRRPPNRYGESVITVQRSIVTSTPVERVFAYMADFTHAVEWDPGTVACTLFSGDGGEGSRYINRSKFLGMETELTYEVLEVEPSRLIVLRGTNETVTTTDYLLVQPAAAGSELLYTAEFEFTGLGWLFEPLMILPLNALGNNAESRLHEVLSDL